MKKIMRRAACALVLAVVASPVSAQGFPSRPLKLVVTYAPGGGADSVARIVARKVSENMGQPIVIENKGGAGSILGTDLVAKAEPDGYTLLLGQSGPISINPAVYKTLPYDPVKDFAPITMTTAYPDVLVVNSESPAASRKAAVRGAMRSGRPTIVAWRPPENSPSVRSASSTSWVRQPAIGTAKKFSRARLAS